MSIRFAAARSAGSSVIAGALFAATPRGAANDNHTHNDNTGSGIGIGHSHGLGSDRLLMAALRHFAEHGLSAAERARHNAEEAFFAGRSEEYRWWLAICAALDRRMAGAAAIDRRNAPAAFASTRVAGEVPARAAVSRAVLANDPS